MFLKFKVNSKIGFEACKSTKPSKLDWWLSSETQGPAPQGFMLLRPRQFHETKNIWEVSEIFRFDQCWSTGSEVETKLFHRVLLLREQLDCLNTVPRDTNRGTLQTSTLETICPYTAQTCRVQKESNIIFEIEAVLLKTAQFTHWKTAQSLGSTSETFLISLWEERGPKASLLVQIFEFNQLDTLLPLLFLSKGVRKRLKSSQFSHYTNLVRLLQV